MGDSVIATQREALFQNVRAQTRDQKVLEIGRGDRLRPGPFDSRYRGLLLLGEKLRRIIDSNQLPPGETVLDYGCGNKPYESLFNAKFKYYVGVDLASNKRADLAIGPEGRLSVKDQSIDCVLSTQVLEHVENPEMYLSEAYRVLKPGGALILSTHGVWRYHPDPADYWRWTIDGLQIQVYQAGFDICSMQSVFGMASCALQLWQDATVESMPRLVQPIYVWLLQFVIGFIESRLSKGVSTDACVYVVLARKRASRHLSLSNLEAHRRHLAVQDMEALIPPRKTFILVDECQWGGDILVDRDAIPFLERNGQYWGPPPDNRTAIREFERLRQAGASFMVFARPAFWWLDWYSALHRHLRRHFPCILENDRLVIFDLQRQ